MIPYVQIEAFSPDVSRKLGWYVYRLIDPRNGETFYVGKGKGNRVFSHIHAAAGLEGDDVDNKIRRIRQIQLGGFEVAHVVHRHGMDERTAFEVEAALMDACCGSSAREASLPRGSARLGGHCRRETCAIRTGVMSGNGCRKRSSGYNSSPK
jgi:hypothetical protein